MKTVKLFLSAALLAFGTAAFAQTPPLIIDENFQSFKEQGWKNDTSDCNQKKPDSKANFKVTKTYGSNKVEYTFVKASVAPACGSKKAPSEVSAGYVEVNKKDGSLTVSQQAYISTVEVGASATGDERGYALFKSVNGGAWVKVGEYIGTKSAGYDAQYGFVDKITINESNVALKFVPTECGKDEKALQTFRIHDIKVYGK